MDAADDPHAGAQAGKAPTEHFAVQLYQAGGAGGGWYEDPYKSQPGAAGNGGSGIVILRGTQEDNIPVIFNGTQLDKIIYNGVTLTSLIYNGTKLYCRNMKQALGRLMRRNGYEICHLG